MPPYKRGLAALAPINNFKDHRAEKPGRVVVIGDFNTSGIHWTADNDDPSFLAPIFKSDANTFKAFVDLTAEHQLYQVCDVFNTKGVYLDLVTTSIPSTKHPSSIHHFPLDIVLTSITTLANSAPSVTNKTDLDKVKKELCTTTFSAQPDEFTRQLLDGVNKQCTKARQTSEANWLKNHPWLRGNALYVTLNRA